METYIQIYPKVVSYKYIYIYIDNRRYIEREGDRKRGGKMVREKVEH